MDTNVLLYVHHYNLVGFISMALELDQLLHILRDADYLILKNIFASIGGIPCLNIAHPWGPFHIVCLIICVI